MCPRQRLNWADLVMRRGWRRSGPPRTPVAYTGCAIARRWRGARQGRAEELDGSDETGSVDSQPHAGAAGGCLGRLVGPARIVAPFGLTLQMDAPVVGALHNAVDVLGDTGLAAAVGGGHARYRSPTSERALE